MKDQQIFLADFEEPANYVPASGSDRFAHLLADSIISVLTASFFVSLIPAEKSKFDYPVLLVVYFLYYSITEFAFKGRTIAKFITGTKVVNRNGRDISFKKAALRTFVRLIPFDLFSFLGKKPTGWHDKWTKTIVLKVKNELP